MSACVYLFTRQISAKVGISLILSSVQTSLTSLSFPLIPRRSAQHRLIHSLSVGSSPAKVGSPQSGRRPHGVGFAHVGHSPESRLRPPIAHGPPPSALATFCEGLFSNPFVTFSFLLCQCFFCVLHQPESLRCNGHGHH